MRQTISRRRALAVSSLATTTACGSVAAATGRRYGDSGICALDAATGRPVWTSRLAGPAADIATGARAVYALDEHGTAYGIRI